MLEKAFAWTAAHLGVLFFTIFLFQDGVFQTCSAEEAGPTTTLVQGSAPVLPSLPLGPSST